MRTILALLVLAAAVLLLPAAPAAAAPSCSSVSISGPSNVYAETSCVTPSWSAVCSCPSGATPSYTWFIDGSYAGNGSSASRLYCPQSPPDAYTMNVTVTIQCGRSHYQDIQSVFVSLCDNTGWGYPLCLG